MPISKTIVPSSRFLKTRRTTRTQLTPTKNNSPPLMWSKAYALASFALQTRHPDIDFDYVSHGSFLQTRGFPVGDRLKHETNYHAMRRAPKIASPINLHKMSRIIPVSVKRQMPWSRWSGRKHCELVPTLLDFRHIVSVHCNGSCPTLISPQQFGCLANLKRPKLFRPRFMFIISAKCSHWNESARITNKSALESKVY